MRSIICAVLLAARVAVEALETRQNAVDKVLRTRLRRLNPRNDVILRPIKARVFPYFEDMSFVSSPCFDSKRNMISVDTGSSDLWINSNLWCDCDEAVTDPEGKKMCANIASYFSKNEKKVEVLEYADSLTVWGNYVKEALYYGADDTVLEGAWFMAATDFTGPNRPGTANGVSGMVGLGYIRNQASAKRYSTLPYLLLENKKTSSTAFSMWFEPTPDEDEFVAQLIFGGYAQGIYKNRPETFEIVGEASDLLPTEIKIKLDRIQVGGQAIQFSSPGHLKVLLDTGSYSSWLPLDTFTRIANALGKNTIDWNKERVFAVYEDCRDWDLSQTMNFQFGKTVIRVPLSEIVRVPTEEEVKDKDYSGTECVTHGIAAYADYYSYAIVHGMGGAGLPDLSRDNILGVTFLRYAYILYDLAADKIHMAAIDQQAVVGHKEKLYMYTDGFDT